MAEVKALLRLLARRQQITEPAVVRLIEVTLRMSAKDGLPKLDAMKNVRGTDGLSSAWHVMIGSCWAIVKNFTREEFGPTHRYAVVLHTDEPHPHMHVVVRVVSEHRQGTRLGIRKGTPRMAAGIRSPLARPRELPPTPRTEACGARVNRR